MWHCPHKQFWATRHGKARLLRDSLSVLAASPAFSDASPGDSASARLELGSHDDLAADCPQVAGKLVATFPELARGG